MSTEVKKRTIAVLAIDGEHFAVKGNYEGQARKASFYTITNSRDGRVVVDNCEQFPTHQSIRELMAH